MATLIGKQAPDFTAKAVVGSQVIDKFSLSDLRGKNTILLFYPLDFTFVCPTELWAFQEKLGDFAERNTQVVGCSVDSHHCHLAWLRTPKNEGGVEGISYPLVADINHTIARDYGVLGDDESIAYRGLFLIDAQGIIRHFVVNDRPLGRSVDEALRMVDALTFHEQNGEVCPANWNKGARTMSESHESVVNYFKQPASV